MVEPSKEEAIRAWQKKLEATFSYNGRVGGRYLASTIAAEQETGTIFWNKFRGHRVLTDSFMEFFGQTLHGQWAFNNEKGWPQDNPHYAPCFLQYLTIYRTIRSSEVLSVNGYTLAAYAIQRSIKDQLFILCAAANQVADFDELFGWKGFGGSDWSEEQKAQLVKNRQKIEGKIKERIRGKRSALSEESQTELDKWDRLFNWEVHRALFSWSLAGQRLFVQRDLGFGLGPSEEPLGDSMFLNRSMETNWMALRLIPYLRRPETPVDDDWDMKWNLLEESFRFMFDGFSALGKKIAPAFLEMLEAKFKFDHETAYFVEPKIADAQAGR